MRIYRLVSTAVGGVFMASISTAAFAGCGFGVPVQNCNPNVVAHAGTVDNLSAVHTYEHVPYGHLKTFAYKNTPNVNITRLHSRAPFVSLNDRPVGFTQGCTPTSTVYCRGDQAPVRPIAYAQQPAPQPYIAPPVYTAPRPAPQPTSVSNGGYWERASGPALIDGLPATQIICRRPVQQYVPRPMPRPITVQVVRPVIGVPTPIPTPVPVPVYMPRPYPMPMPAPMYGTTCGGFQAPMMGQNPRSHPRANRYGSRWTY